MKHSEKAHYPAHNRMVPGSNPGGPSFSFAFLRLYPAHSGGSPHLRKKFYAHIGTFQEKRPVMLRRSFPNKPKASSFFQIITSSFLNRSVVFRMGLLVLFALCFGCSQETEPTQPVPPSKLSCQEGTLKFGIACVPMDTIQSTLVNDVMKLVSFEDRALTEEEIRDRIGPVFDKYVAKSNSETIRLMFEREVFKRTKTLDARSLRLLLDIRYYHDNFSHTVYASFSEGMRDMIIPFIEKKPALVITIVKDEAQMNRKIISNAFYQFIDQFAIDQKTGRIIDDRFTAEDKELMVILKDKEF